MRIWELVNTIQKNDRVTCSKNNMLIRYFTSLFQFERTKLHTVAYINKQIKSLDQQIIVNIPILQRVLSFRLKNNITDGGSTALKLLTLLTLFTLFKLFTLFTLFTLITPFTLLTPLTLLTWFALFTLFILFKLLYISVHCFNRSMYVHILLGKVRTLLEWADAPLK